MKEKIKDEFESVQEFIGRMWAIASIVAYVIVWYLTVVGLV